VAPTAVGSYAVFAIVDTTSFQGSASGTLVIKPGKQTISFPEAASVAAGSRTALVATASSGLPVSFAVVSGPARIEGGLLVALGRGTVVVRALQPGNGSYAPAPDVDRSVSVGLAAQTISFDVASAGAVGASLPLKASATSGLPVVIEVLSGPGRIDSGVLFLTAAGEVIVRAMQPGDAHYAPAAAVERRVQVAGGVAQTFLAEVVDPNQSARRGRVAAFLSGDGRSLNLILLAPEIGLQGAFNVQIAADGSFSLQVATAATSGSAERGPARAASTPGQVTLRGSVRDGQLAIDFSELGLRAAARALPAAGPGTAVTGAYRADFIGTLQGTVQAIALPSGQAAVLLQGPDGVFGGILDLGTGYSFSGALSGATQVSGVFAADKGALTGTFKLPNEVQADFSGLATSQPATGRLINLSSLARSGSGDATLIAGFTVEGSAQRTFLVRGAGPSLAGFGVAVYAANPRLRFYQGASLLAENDDWHAGPSGAGGIAAVSSRVGAFPLAEGSADAALLSTVGPGSYTVHVEAGGADGLALAEIYDAGTSAVASLSNLAVRSTLDAAGGALTVGFVIDGNAPRRLLVRAIGPGLAPFGVAGVVADPRLIVRREATVVAENDNWNADEASGIPAAARGVGAFSLPAGSKDAVLLLTLAPGAYTAQMTAASGGGVGLVEVYQLP
ncbi:MAG: MBG domain-containing protein, partial [Opitutaceae bacterium]